MYASHSRSPMEQLKCADEGMKTLNDVNNPYEILLSLMLYL